MLCVKIGCPVILVCNLSSEFANGMTGTVTAIVDDRPVVAMGGKSLHLERHNFTVFDLRCGRVRTQRLQFPIRLAYALTVHKAQGQSLPNVVVDCAGFFLAGQVGVAVGRAVSIAGLQIKNYHSGSSSRKHPDLVYDFYDTPTFPLSGYGNLDCCRTSVYTSLVEPPSSTAVLAQQPCTSTAVADEFPHANADKADTLGFPWEVTAFSRKVFPVESNMTARQSAIHDVLPKMKLDKLLAKIYSFMLGIAEKLDVKTMRQPLINKQCASINDYLCGEEFRETCVQCVGHAISEVEKHIASRLANNIWRKILDERSTIVVTNQSTGQTSDTEKGNTEIPDVVRAKVRYIAGACITKVTGYLTRNIQNKLVNEKSRTQRQVYAKQRCMLLTLRSPEAEVMETTLDHASLEYVSFKQGATHGLVHMSDNVFSFFLNLYRKISHLHTTTNMHTYMESLLNLTQNEIGQDDTLLGQFFRLFEFENDAPAEDDTEQELIVHLVIDLYSMVTDHFNRVHFAELLHRFKQEIPKRKRQALRPSLESKSKQKPETGLMPQKTRKTGKEK